MEKHKRQRERADALKLVKERAIQNSRHRAALAMLEKERVYQAIEALQRSPTSQLTQERLKKAQLHVARGSLDALHRSK